MKPVVTRLYAVLVLLTLVGLAAWAGTDWYQHRLQGLADAQAALRHGAGLVTDLSVRGQPVDRTTLGQAFAQALGDDSRWKTVVLWSAEAGTQYYRGPRPEADPAVTVPHWSPKPASEVLVTLPVFRANGSALTLEGIREFYGRAEIFSLLKACGVTLLILLVLTSAVVVIGSRRPSPAGDEEDEPESEPEVAADPTPSFVDEPAPSFDLPDAPELKTDDEYWFDEELSMEDLEPPTSGPSVGSEDSFVDGLETALTQAAAASQELSLLLVAPKGEAPPADEWEAMVREAFGSSATLWHFEGGLAVAVPGLGLDPALKTARALTLHADATWPSVRLHVGAAARSGRILGATTLANEARSARRRTLAGTVRVLGLKVDAERWRDHLSASA